MTGSVQASSCGAVLVGRALDHQDLRAALDRVVVRERDVDRAVRPHEWARRMVEVALVRTDAFGLAADLDGCRPGDAAILGLAEDDREDLANPAGRILLLGTDARPGHVHPVALRARRARVCDHVRLVLEAHVLVADDAHRQSRGTPETHPASPASGSTRRGYRSSTSRRRPRSPELRPCRSCSRCRRYLASPRRPSDPNKPRRRVCRGAGPGRTAESRRPSALRRRASRRSRSGCNRYGRRSGRRGCCSGREG